MRYFGFHDIRDAHRSHHAQGLTGYLETLNKGDGGEAAGIPLVYPDQLT